jgi:hypothetical protein
VVCDDGVPCTNDACDQSQGGCVSVPELCGDADPCTLDACEDDACTHAPIQGCEGCQKDEDCLDDTACTVNACLEGQCVYEKVECDDDDPCTVAGCLPATGSCVVVTIPGCTPP